VKGDILTIAKNSDMNLHIRFSVNMKIFMGLEEFWRIREYLKDFWIIAQFQIICTISDF